MPIDGGLRPTPFSFPSTKQENLREVDLSGKRGYNRNLLEQVRGATSRSSFTRLRRDLVISHHNRQAEISFALWRFNSFAKRIINTYVDFIVSDGIRPISTDKSTQEALTAFWDHPYNRWDKMIHRRVRDLLIYGELLHSPSITEDGNVLVNAFQPTIISDIFVLPTNHEVVTSIKYFCDYDRTEEEEAKLILPQFGSEGLGEFTGYNEDGKFFLFGINQTTDSPRGVGELFTLIDHIDVFDDMLFNRALKIGNTSNMWWDLVMEGFTTEQITNYLSTAVNLPPEPGTVWAHNERAILELKSAPTYADEYAEDVKTQRSHILGSAAIPGTWVDASGDSGGATASEMTEATYKAIVSFQKQIEGFLRTEIDFMLYQRQQKNPSFAPKDYIVRFSRPSVRDLQRNASGLHRISQALHMAWEIGAVSTEQAAGVFVDHLNEVGVAGVPLVADAQEPPLLKLKKQQQKSQQQKPPPQPEPDKKGGSGREPSTNDND